MNQDKMFFDIGARLSRKWVKTAQAHAKSGAQKRAIYQMSRDAPKVRKTATED